MLRNTVNKAVLIRRLFKKEVLSCCSTATEASPDEFKMTYLDHGNEKCCKIKF